MINTKNSIISVLSLSFAVTMGCASSNSALDSKEFTKPVVAKTETDVKKIYRGCPASNKTWIKLDWKSLLPLANQCVLSKKWSQVGNMGAHLAEIQPENPWGFYYLSLAAEGQNSYYKALWMIESALQKSNQNGLLHFQKARVLWLMGELELSVDSFNRSIALDNSLVEPRLILAQLYLQQNQNSKAEDFFKQAIDLQPRNKEALYFLATLLEGQQRSSEALTYYKKLREQLTKSVFLSVNIDGKIAKLEASKGGPS